MPVTIHNEFISVRIKEKGAELESLFHNELGLEYIWNANPAFWGKSSPVLFPIVGQLLEDKYRYQNKTYSLPRHGFARDQIFELEIHTDTHAVFLLKSNESTRSMYPFDFELRINYRLDKNRLTVGYSVKNTGVGEMYFSIGAHPAFAVPLVKGTEYEDYYLSFSKAETSPRWTISKGGQIGDAEPFLDSTSTLQLKKELFSRDALVFKGLESDQISIKSDKHLHGIDFGFSGFPYFGIWAAPGADFVCLEPWCGIADSVKHNQELKLKEGIEKLLPAGSWERQWSVTCY